LQFLGFYELFDLLVALWLDGFSVPIKPRKVKSDLLDWQEVAFFYKEKGDMI